MDAPKQFNFRFYSWSSQLINLFMAVTLKKISTGCEAKPRGKRSSENDLQLKKPFQTI